MNNEKSPYLPKVRTDYYPTQSKIESVSEDGSVAISLPNPAVDDIVVNNIASMEFDYTQDMTSSENSDLNSTDPEKNYFKHCNK
ncbi:MULTISPECIES: hypothetical protein [Clostridium]|uniref:Uncharacterized protein n=1 Tax=Clostridium aquiflavi TaxID=3073603 RepID=A0ABU1EJC2_9CLOT|nr:MULTISPECIES: hypothetical protein [unclassified Clostridium]MDR5588487.1 hypothetical protein [Clostridium sp. 5N-1]NFG60710.1 hypothetical protein [Clostridium botulinum]NFQ08144.1 hypothetical protein [Clostridium botulinum]